jgi:uncharacterized membrane protein
MLPKFPSIYFTFPHKFTVMPPSMRYQKLIQYFLQGLLILGPFTITVYAIYVVFDKIDSILRPVINIPGIGFVMIIGFILLVGYLSSFFMMSRILSVIDKLLDRTPGIKLFYSFIKDFFEAFAGSKKKFTNSVLANVENNNVWRVGFITQEDMSRFDLADFVAVYVPMAYSVAGNVYIVPKERVRAITNISSAQTMKFAMSGGVTEVIEDSTR